MKSQPMIHHVIITVFGIATIIYGLVNGIIQTAHITSAVYLQRNQEDIGKTAICWNQKHAINTLVGKM
jgi:hypothetical protein